MSIERALTDVEPPAFVARMRIDPRARCKQQVNDFEVVQAFRIGGVRPEVVVHHAKGEMRVEVTEFSVHGPGTLTPGRAFPPDPFGEPSEADGYSRNYDLGEAIREALGKLPDRGSAIPDWLNVYTIDSMAVEIGGIGGFNHLKVTLRG